MTLRKVGRIATDLAAGALVLTAIASLTGVPARFSRSPASEAVSGPDVAKFLAQPVLPILPVPIAACERPTLIGRVTARTAIAKASPSARSRVVASFPRINREGAPQVFDLLGWVRDGGGDLWYRALLPMRPNGTTGYVSAGAIRVVHTSYRIVVDRQRLRLTLWDGCARRFTFRIGLGKESTPTPNGHYYLIALLKPPVAGSIYGTYAYGLSAYSDVLTHWKDGGVIGLHGTNDPSSIGNRESHGCIRLYNRDIEKLVPLLPLGTPVVIR